MIMKPGLTITNCLKMKTREDAQEFVQVHFVFSTRHATYSVTFSDRLARRIQLLGLAERVTRSSHWPAR